ncbi:radical SAM protein [Blautia schinkii]|nr:radical SAM protein [Blautia schinkii]
MYTITLEVNQICNLRCTYCYLGKKTNQKMSEQTAYKGLEIAFLNVEKHRDRRLWVDFVGGEALLSFSFIKQLVEYIEEQALKRDILVTYSITTNGTILNDEVLAWLIRYKIHLKVSIDGDEETHNRNRKWIDGGGSYANIIENCTYFKEYEKNTKQYIQAAHVVTQNNYGKTFQSVCHLVENLNFRVVDSSIDVMHRWTTNQLDGLADEWEKVLCYYIKRQKEGKAFLWGPVLDLKKYGENNGKSGFCGVGLIQIYVKVDGRIFGCAANLEASGGIGDVDNGLSMERIKRLRRMGREGNMCSKCSFNMECQSKNCIMNSLAYSGTMGGHNPDMCYFEQKRRSLWEVHAKEL